MTLRACRFIVTGNVQGVFFRSSTCEEARRLGLRGYAKNLPDGSVEVVAAGKAVAIDALGAWLQHGPPMAKVANVHRSEVAHADAERLDGFAIS